MVIQSLDLPPVQEMPAVAAVRESRPLQALPSAGQVMHEPQVLSNESTFTQWAYVARIASVHAQPSSSSTVVARLHRNTEDGFPEIYLLLRASSDAQGREWIELRVPGRPNGQAG
jgi:hypothetical protein